MNKASREKKEEIKRFDKNGHFEKKKRREREGDTRKGGVYKKLSDNQEWNHEKKKSALRRTKEDRNLGG